MMSMAVSCRRNGTMTLVPTSVSGCNPRGTSRSGSMVWSTWKKSDDTVDMASWFMSGVRTMSAGDANLTPSRYSSSGSSVSYSINMRSSSRSSAGGGT